MLELELGILIVGGMMEYGFGGGDTWLIYLNAWFIGRMVVQRQQC